MAESEGIKETVNQLAVQAATSVMMALRDAKKGPQPNTMASHGALQRQRHSEQILVQPALN